MAEILNGVNAQLQQSASGALNIGVIVIVLLVAFTFLVAIAFFIRHQRRWNQFIVKVWAVDAFGQYLERIDKGGIFTDKALNARRLFIKGLKTSVNPDDLPIFMNAKGKRVIYVFQTGQKSVRVIAPDFIKETPDLFKLTVKEEDVNWALSEYEKVKNFLNKDLMQYLPYIMMAIVCLIIMIIFIYFFKKLDVLEAFGQALVEASRNLNPNFIPTNGGVTP